VTRALRAALGSRDVGRGGSFRWRGHEVTRLEGFTDAVFAFAVTLLVVSLEVPKTFEELTAAMRGFLPFGVCFGILIWIWYEHYLFFRRYGLQDARTVFYNALLLFVVLFYVYPLKFLFRLVLGPVAGMTSAPMDAASVRTLFVIYGAGVIAVFGVLALLHIHALRRRAALELEAIEVFDTKSNVLRHIEMASVGLLSVILARTLPARAVGLAGYVYFLFGVLQAAHGAIAGARRRRLFEKRAS
jgi:uncharacterized membrane protein